MHVPFRWGYPASQATRHAVHFMGECERAFGREPVPARLTARFATCRVARRSGLSTLESAPLSDRMLDAHHWDAQHFELLRGGRFVPLDWRARAAQCQRSPFKCTAFGVVVDRAIHNSIGILPRLCADAHHRNSQCFEWLGIELSTTGSMRSCKRVPITHH